MFEFECRNCGKLYLYNSKTHASFVLILYQEGNGIRKQKLVKTYCKECLPKILKDEIAIEEL